MSSFKNFDVLSITECHQFFMGHQGKGYSVMGRNISWIIIFLGIWWQLTENGYCLINEKRTWKSNHKAKSLVIALIFNMFSSTTCFQFSFVSRRWEGRFLQTFRFCRGAWAGLFSFLVNFKAKTCFKSKKDTHWNDKKSFLKSTKKRINVNWDPHGLLIIAYSYYVSATS